MNLGFYMPTKVIVGKDCVRENSDVFKIGKKALIVTGKNSAKLSGALDDVKYALEKNNIEYVIFDKVMSNPTVECVYDGAETAMEEEVDFVINRGSQRYYIQVAYDMASEEKQNQEFNSLRNIPDSFKKIIIVNGTKKPWRNDEGFVIMGMKYFLLNADSLEF